MDNEDSQQELDMKQDALPDAKQPAERIDTFGERIDRSDKSDEDYELEFRERDEFAEWLLRHRDDMDQQL